MAASGGRGIVVLLLGALVLLSVEPCKGRLSPELPDSHGRRTLGIIDAIRNVVTGGHDQESDQDGSQASAHGPIVTKTARALLYAATGEMGANRTVPVAATLPFGGNSSVYILRPGPNEVVLSFNVTEVPVDRSSWQSDAERVPFLQQWVYTSEAPAQLLDLFLELVEGPGLNGTLAQAVDAAAGGNDTLRVLCTGEGAGGGLAVLCGPWAALQYGLADVDVITFGAPWAGFNTQFGWSFTRLITLSHFWNFTADDLNSTTGSGQGIFAEVADQVSRLVNTDAVLASIVVPNLPSSIPPGWPDDMDTLGDLAPIEAQFEPAPGPCPAILCKTRSFVRDACWYGNASQQTEYFKALPQTVLHAKSGADATVAWDNHTNTGIILWQGTEQRIDWLQDAILFQSSDFRPGNLSELIPGVKVHRGFLNQLSSLTTDPADSDQNITAVLLNLSNGTQPWRVVVAGHSLGAALSEMCAVWVATVWPGAHISVYNTGAPMAGDGDWENMFRAVVGRAVRYVNHLDQVPSLPPFDSFHQVPEGLWLRDDLVLLQDRPSLTVKQTTWDDHSCGTLYVPQVEAAQAVTVPGFVYNATAA
ncbi:hypothetical protein N2152v2_005574 [Parachlorella kessleri]